MATIYKQTFKPTVTNIINFLKLSPHFTSVSATVLTLSGTSHNIFFGSADLPHPNSTFFNMIKNDGSGIIGTYPNSYYNLGDYTVNKSFYLVTSTDFIGLVQENADPRYSGAVLGKLNLSDGTWCSFFNDGENVNTNKIMLLNVDDTVKYINSYANTPASDYILAPAQIWGNPQLTFFPNGLFVGGSQDATLPTFLFIEDMDGRLWVRICIKNYPKNQNFILIN